MAVDCKLDRLVARLKTSIGRLEIIRANAPLLVLINLGMITLITPPQAWCFSVGAKTAADNPYFETNSVRHLAEPKSLSQKFSLVIGIDHYQPPKNNTGEALGDLRGCVTDCRKIDSLLCARRFPLDHLHHRELKDDQATGEAICAELQWLIHTVNDGDAVVIYFSGHGNFLANPNFGQLKGLQDPKKPIDEAICPYDDLQNGVILDYQLRVLLNQMKSRNVTVVLDSCFSGTATKVAPFLAGTETPRPIDALGLVGIRNRFRGTGFTATPSAYVDRTVNAYVASHARKRSAQVKNVTVSRWEPLRPTVVTLSACQPWEVASDRIPGASDDSGGLFTELLCRSLSAVGSKGSWRDVMKCVRLQAAEFEPIQEPFCDGPIDRRPFCADNPAKGSRLPLPFLTNLAKSDDDIKIEVDCGRLDDNGQPITDAFLSDDPNFIQDATSLRREITNGLTSLADTHGVHVLGPNDVVSNGTNDSGMDLTVAVLALASGFTLDMPLYSHIGLKCTDLNSVMTHLRDGARFVSKSRKLARLAAPSWWHSQVRLSLDGGPSLSDQSGAVRGSFVLTQGEEARVGVYRIDSCGNVYTIFSSTRCLIGRRYKFSYPTENAPQGKELIKVVAFPVKPGIVVGSPTLSDLTGLERDTPVNGGWAEDQVSLYIGNPRSRI